MTTKSKSSNEPVVKKELVAPTHIFIKSQSHPVEVVFNRPYRETVQDLLDSIARLQQTVGYVPIVGKAKDEGES